MIRSARGTSKLSLVVVDVDGTLVTAEKGADRTGQGRRGGEDVRAQIATLRHSLCPD